MPMMLIKIGASFWPDVMAKETKDVRVTFNICVNNKGTISILDTTIMMLLCFHHQDGML